MRRYLQLDWLRGLAVLGIILLNINSFALPSAAYLNPAWQGMPSLSNSLSWALIDLFARLKFVNIFALLFGAGLNLQLAKGRWWLDARLGWLILAGALHYLLLWPGDILLDYGLCGLLVWRVVAKNNNNSVLLTLGTVCYLSGVLVLSGYALLLNGHAANDWVPDAITVQAENQAHLQATAAILLQRLQSLENDLLGLVTQSGFQLSGLMMIGAALMRNGWLTGQFSARHYRKCAVLFLMTGFLPEAVTLLLQWHLQWQAEWCQFYLQLPSTLCSPLISLGYIALLQASWSTVISHPLSPWIIKVGQMAFSNYIMDTLLGLIIFDLLQGFMCFQRWQLLLWVPLFWCVNLYFSACWLQYYPRGPLETLWRALTQWSQRS